MKSRIVPVIAWTLFAVVALGIMCLTKFISSNAQETTQEKKWKIEQVGPKRRSNKAREEPDPRHADWTIEDRMPMHLPIKVEIVDLDMTSLLSDVQVKVTNNANKPIYFLELAIVLPENLSPDGYPIDFPLQYGREALIRFETPTEPGDEPLHPGDSAVLRIPQKYLSGFQKYVAKGKIEHAEVRKAYLMFRRLNFGDQTGIFGDGSPFPPTQRDRSAITLIPRKGRTVQSL